MDEGDPAQPETERRRGHEDHGCLHCHTWNGTGEEDPLIRRALQRGHDIFRHPGEHLNLCGSRQDFSFLSQSFFCSVSTDHLSWAYLPIIFGTAALNAAIVQVPVLHSCKGIARGAESLPSADASPFSTVREKRVSGVMGILQHFPGPRSPI